MASIYITICVLTIPTPRLPPDPPHTRLIPSHPLSSPSCRKPKSERPAPLASLLHGTWLARNLSKPLANRIEKVAAQDHRPAVSGYGWSGPETGLWLNLAGMTAGDLKHGRGAKTLRGGGVQFSRIKAIKLQ